MNENKGDGTKNGGSSSNSTRAAKVCSYEKYNVWILC